jgi:hypothetical protein
MIAEFIVYAFVAAIVISVSVVVFRIVRRGPKRTIHDLIPLLEPINLDEIEVLLDPGEASFLRSNFSDTEFSALQSKRLDLAREYLRRMARNAAVLTEWADREIGRNTATEELASELHRDAVYVRIYALSALMWLNLWVILRLGPSRWLPTSMVTDCRKCAGISGLPAYGKLKNTAANLVLQFGYRESEQLLQHL